MLPDEMEAEKNRKIILGQTQRIEMLEKNVRDLQKQLNEAYIKIAKIGENNESGKDLG